jgi:serine/threonine-protein kinase
VEVELGGTGSPANRTPKIAGTAFGKYTLLAKLATGGMGELFVARNAGAGGFEKLVVIKRLLPHLAEDAHFVAMLLDEARIAARLSHPNVCQVHDLGEVDGHYYIAMEHLEGVPASLILRRASRAGQRLDLGLATAILRQAADGLDHAHNLCDSAGKSVGLVHRDVSPSNLFVTDAGTVKVLDFGVAKSQDALARTHTGALKGKYAYMSPEHVVGHPVDRRSDVWSLGVVLYELLTAQRLFWRDSEYKMFQAIIEEPIPSLIQRRPGLPPRVAQVADRALSRDPRLRFASAREMGEALEEAMGTSSSGGVWRTIRVGDYVSEHFGALLAERREEVHAALVACDSRAAVAAPDEQSDAGDEQAGGGATDDVDAMLVDVSSAEHTEKIPRWRGRTWLGLAALAALLGGGGLFGYHQWMGGPEAVPTPVVVLGGEVETQDGKVTRAPGPRPGDVVARRAGSAAPTAPIGVAPAAQPAPDRGPAANPFSAALARHQGEIERCFNKTTTSIVGAPELAVAFDIDDRGAVSGAGLVPRDLEATELGECVLGIARRVRFPRQREPVRVTIPLRVRRR